MPGAVKVKLHSLDILHRNLKLKEFNIFCTGTTTFNSITSKISVDFFFLTEGYQLSQERGVLTKLWPVTAERTTSAKNTLSAVAINELLKYFNQGIVT